MPNTHKTVLLINPRATYVDEIAQKCYPPMHLLYLAACLRQAGFGVEVLDANAFRLSDQQLIDRARALGPAVIGLSLYSEILRQVRDLTLRLKSACPDAFLVLGGPHATAVPGQTLQQFGAVHCLLTGETEDSFPALCRALTDGAPVSGIPGVVYRRNGEITAGPPYTFPNVNAVPRPARDLVEQAYSEKRYYTLMVRRRPVDTLFTSRGCPFKCGFCYNFRFKYRARDPEEVVDELGGIRERGIRDVEICDDTFTIDHRRALAIFDKIIERNLDISFRIKSRVDVFTEELASRGREAGVYLVAFGMESGAQRILDAMHKRITLEQSARACALCRKYGMLSHSSWVIGYPGETPETVEETVNFVLKHRPSTVNVAVLRPYPETRAYHTAKESGDLVGDWDPDAEQMPWVRLPWAREKRVLDDLCKRVMRRIYFTPFYMSSFASQIVRGANWTLARYAVQETLKVCGLRRKAPPS
ncbi:MAG: B12-binding domain-containing radical SAM protein [Kiritimatiellae bacterium]|nr:B12-binding domain-containing radical SAM protein [Kiritimatiellia bacterium]